MSLQWPGGILSKTPPTITAPTDGEGGSASGMWTIAEAMVHKKAGNWPLPILDAELYAWGNNSSGELHGLKQRWVNTFRWPLKQMALSGLGGVTPLTWATWATTPPLAYPLPYK